MGFDLNGFVLRPARAATGNAKKTDEATTGVDRDHIYPDDFPSPYVAKPTEGPVEPYADMYRAAVLLQPESRKAKEEYCLFAATTGSLSTLESDIFTIMGGASTAYPIAGDLTVTNSSPPPTTYTDGSLSFYIRDDGARDISSVTSVTIRRGDNGSSVVCLASTFDPVSGLVKLSDGGLGGGYSPTRGDVVVATYYQLAGVTFWWTRNDEADGVQRFGWDGKIQKWLPLKGTPARSLGPIDPDETYNLQPAPTRFAVGDTLPYDAGSDDSYALVRAGLYADSGSTALNIQVVTDEEADAESWTFGAVDAVLGVDSAVLRLNPDFAQTNAGRTLWYNAETFVPEADGDLGSVADFPTDTIQGFPSLSPIPGPTERPFLRIGNRTYLTPIAVDQDVASGSLTGLPDPSAVTTGQFYWSRTTGKVVLSEVDINKCQPGVGGYEIAFLGARLYYDGVALSTQPIPVRAPSPIIAYDGTATVTVLDGDPDGVPSGDELFVQKAQPLPPPGVSGISWVPDGSGDTPSGTSVPATQPQTRPNGSGLKRRVTGITGDSFFFTGSPTGDSYAYANIGVEEYDEDLPTLAVRVPKSKVEVSRQSMGAPATYPHASRIKARRRPVLGDAFYYRQTMVIPSVYSDTARLYSRFMGPYVLDGTEVFRFVLGDPSGAPTVHEWSAATLGAGTFTAQEIADSLQNDTAGAMPADSTGVLRNRVFIQDPTNSGIEIGWNNPSGPATASQTNLSGHAALGFLPGWKVIPGDPLYRWLPDNGAAVGVFRSPVNLNRRDSTPDIRAKSRFNNKVLNENISSVPFVTILQPPLEDIPGYEEGSHFRVRAGLLRLNLKNYQTVREIGVKYDWPNDRFEWITEGVTKPTQLPYRTSTLQLSQTGVLPETVSSAAMLDSSFGLDFKPALAAAYSELTRKEEFLMPGRGAPGQAFKVEVVGGVISEGGNGTFAQNGTAFSDPNTSLGSVEAGDLLQILNGDSEGVYTFTSSTEVTPPFPSSGGGANGPAQWRIFEAKTRADLDPTLLADVQQVPTNYLPSEPFKIRVLTSAGSVGDALTVDPVDALRSERVVRIRFGLPSTSSEAVPAYLVQGTPVGTVAEEGLELPDLTDPHVTNSTTASYFQLRVGTTAYSTSAGNLTLNGGVAPASGIDVDTTTGAILMDSALVSAEPGSSVYYDQLFLPSTALTSGTCEINAIDGSVNLSSADLSTHAGTTAYFVEQMVTKDNLDVTASPMNGTILFNKPLRAMQIVEVNYFQADSAGDKKLDEDGNPIEITEFLPLIVRLEETTRVSDTSFTYNPTGRTLSDTIEPFVWVGVNLQNFAGEETAAIGEGKIELLTPAEEADTVKINYGVLEAFGGEQSYTVSTPPVYSKPFFLTEGQTEFTLETDRTSDFVVGRLMVLSGVPLYITASSYSSSTEETSVTIFPTPLTELGSRAVGQDAALTLSDFLVSVSRGGSAGFMPLLNTDATTGTPLLPADRGQLSVAFFGDVREYTKASHLLEIAGYPYIIVGSSQSEDGLNTIVNLGTPLYRDHDNTDEVRVSVRPVYTPNPVTFTGLGPFLREEEFDLFLMGRTNSEGTALPGKALVENIHYTVDERTGNVSFQAPTQKALRSGEYLHFRRTQLIEDGPEIKDGALFYPLYKAKYLHTTTPTRDNRLLGRVLRADYTYRDPDSFYFEVLPLLDYLPAVAEASESSVVPIGGGPVVATPGAVELNKQGRLGLRGEAADYWDQDRGARAYIELFNGMIVAFEQVLEAIDGRIIGDRDGKFKFFIGRDKSYPPPGWEDAFTGKLNTRLIWREVVDEWAPDGFDGWYKTSDPVFNPVTAEEPEPTDRPGDTDGQTPNPDVLSFFTAKQKLRVKNDMDDRILIGFSRPIGFAALFPSIDVPGRFKQMWQDHVYSRLYPERTRHFSRLFPGLESVENSEGQITDAGFFSSGREITVPGPEPGEETEQTVKTRKSVIGTVTNPAIGDIQGVVDVTAEDRLPRARVWAFFPSGSADLDHHLSLTGTDQTVGKATFVATPLPLSEFPTDPTTGFPDFAELIYTGSSGTLSSLDSGDAELATPGFQVGERLNYGKPSGVIYTLKDGDGNGVFVGTVQKGCVITLMNVDGDAIAGSNVLVNGALPLVEKMSENDGYGDTIFVGPAVPNLDDLPAADGTPTLEESATAIQAIPDYRVQFDLKVRKRAGEFVDNSLPTGEDSFPLPLQSWFGQHPPSPLTCIQGDVEFANTETEPLRLPCLLGEAKDDSGDNQIPYMRSTDTELAVLGRVAASLELLYIDSTINVATPTFVPAVEQQDWWSVYPDEIRFSDGALYDTFSWVGYVQNPATLYTSADLRPVPTGGYVDNTGIGDARRFDPVFIQVPQPSGTLQPAATGILTVGDVNTDIDAVGGISSLEPPRFITCCAAGGTHKYTVRGMSAHVADRDGAFMGVETNEVITIYNRVFWSFTSVPNINLTGLSSLVGGGNALVIRYYDPDPASVAPFLGAVVIPFVAVMQDIYIYNASTGVSTVFPLAPAGTGVTITPTAVQADIGTLSSITTFLGITLGTTFDYSLDIDTYIDSETVSFTAASTSPLVAGSGIGSTTCAVRRDRLTFAESLDFFTAKPREHRPANGDTSYELGAQLAVHEIEINGTSGITVNAPFSVNGSSLQYLTFLSRVGPSPDGTVPAVVDYVGTPGGLLRLMAWEGHGNMPLAPQTEIKAAVAPTSDLGESSIIFEGLGTIQDGDSSLGVNVISGFIVLQGNRNFVLFDSAAIPANGDLSNVEKGDLIVVDSQILGPTFDTGAVKSGTYLTRHAVKGDLVSQTDATSALGVRRLLGATQSSTSSDKPFSTAGAAEGPLDLSFPTITAVTRPSFVTNGSITLKGVRPIYGTPNGHGWESTGSVYAIRKNKYAKFEAASGALPDRWVVDADSVWSTTYTGITSYDAETQVLVLETPASGLPPFQKADGTTALGYGFYNEAVGKKASGMSYFSLGQMGSHMPADNTYGADVLNDGGPVRLVAGFRDVTFGNRNFTIYGPAEAAGFPFTSSRSFQSNVDLTQEVSGTPAPNHLVVGLPLPRTNVTFYSDRRDSVYGLIYDSSGAGLSGSRLPVAGVATYLDVDRWQTAVWNHAHFGTVLPTYKSDGTVSTPTLDCLLPLDRFTISDEIDPTSATARTGFYALEGIFLEPSFPRPVNNLFGASANVVDATHTLTVDDIGVRDFNSFVPVAGLGEEEVRLFVRRLRRWHDAQQEVVSGMEPLRYAYEIRSGDIASYTEATRTFVADTATYGTATNLGAFNNEDVNINAGDTLRVIQVDPTTSARTLVDTAEIQQVVDETTLKLRRPGLTNSDVIATPTDFVFEVYLEQAIVPQAQSNEQLFELITDSVLVDRSVNRSSYSTAGGRAPANNQMQDDAVAAWDVEEGDYVVIDPAGALYAGEEKGARPEGDTSVAGRAAFANGAPAPLDDNRGFYRVTGSTGAILDLDGSSRFSDGTPFGLAGVPNSEYVVLPTISDAGGVPVEAQQDLRITAPPGAGDSYLARTGSDYNKSIEPFAYKIIRPNAIFSKDTIELVLFIRERMLSWIEEITAVYGKGGDYYVFQKDEHIRDVGTAGSALSGLGVLSNDVATSMIGLVDVSPFANTSDCLSVLDRRVWCLDFRLDSVIPSGGTYTYTAFAEDTFGQRPVLPDLISEVLDLDDELREQRYSWISFRANREDGSIKTAKQAQRSLSKRLKKQRRALARKIALDES